MKCFTVVCGSDYSYFKRLTFNSNEYARRVMNISGEFCGLCWSNITVKEMIQFDVVHKKGITHQLVIY